MDSTEKEPMTLDNTVEEAANGGAQLSPEEKELQQQEWRDELAKTEEEVNTLKQVLASKQRRVQELRRNLGITVVANISKDMKDGISKLSESEVVQKANLALKSAGEKTSAALSNVSRKLEDVKNSEFVKSVEEKVGHAYDSVKRSTSLFAIQGEAKVSGNKSVPNTPTTEVNPIVDDSKS